MQTIIFKKQRLGKWRRDDGELKKLVNEEAMFRELGELVSEGWHLKTYEDVNHHIRMAEVTKS